MDKPEQLPEVIVKGLEEFVVLAKEALGPDLRAVVLFGSAAEGRMRSTSDVNVMVVLSAWNATRIDALREPLRTAHAALSLSAMFLLEGEVNDATDAFAVKFADILRRRRVLFGDDPFAGVSVSRDAEIARLKQVLLNLLLRLRERYLLVSLREEQAVRALAEAAGPLRSSAAALLELAGKPASSAKEALAIVTESVPGSGWGEVLDNLSRAREGHTLPMGAASVALLRLIDLTRSLREQAQGLT